MTDKRTGEINYILDDHLEKNPHQKYKTRIIICNHDIRISNHRATSLQK